MIDVSKDLDQRTRLENRIRELGGAIPPSLSWDDLGIDELVNILSGQDCIDRSGCECHRPVVSLRSQGAGMLMNKTYATQTRYRQMRW